MGAPPRRASPRCRGRRRRASSSPGDAAGSWGDLPEKLRRDPPATLMKAALQRAGSQSLRRRRRPRDAGPDGPRLPHPQQRRPVVHRQATDGRWMQDRRTSRRRRRGRPARAAPPRGLLRWCRVLVRGAGEASRKRMRFHEITRLDRAERGALGCDPCGLGSFLDGRAS